MTVVVVCCSPFNVLPNKREVHIRKLLKGWGVGGLAKMARQGVGESRRMKKKRMRKMAGRRKGEE